MNRDGTQQLAQPEPVQAGDQLRRPRLDALATVFSQGEARVQVWHEDGGHEAKGDRWLNNIAANRKQETLKDALGPASFMQPHESGGTPGVRITRNSLRNSLSLRLCACFFRALMAAGDGIGETQTQFFTLATADRPFAFDGGGELMDAVVAL